MSLCINKRKKPVAITFIKDTQIVMTNRLPGQTDCQTKYCLFSVKRIFQSPCKYMGGVWGGCPNYLSRKSHFYLIHNSFISVRKQSFSRTPIFTPVALILICSGKVELTNTSNIGDWMHFFLFPYTVNMWHRRMCAVTHINDLQTHSSNENSMNLHLL